MNVLIINAFGNTKNTLIKYNSFCKVIEKILKQVSFKSGIENFNYIYRSVNDIDDFIYIFPSNQKTDADSNSTYKKNFDKLDMIFIDGNEKTNMPWHKDGTKLLYLIHLCQLTGKSLYAGGIAMLHLFYYSATGGNYKTILNANGEHPTIEDIDKLPIEYVEMFKKGEAFLDYATGDLYELSSRHEWKTINNIGIHKLLYAEKYRERGQFVLKEYKPSKNVNLISCHKKEIKVKIIKQYCLHWLIKSIPVEFVVGTTLTWFGHNYCINSKQSQLKTICDSNYGPIVVEHGNTIGSMFHIDKRFPETITLLHNFITNKFVLAQSKTALVNETKKFDLIAADKLFRTVVKDVSFESIDGEFNNENNVERSSVIKSRPITASTRPTSGSAIVNSSRLYNKVTRHKRVASYCGFSFNTREMIFIKNNPVIYNKIPVNMSNIDSDLQRKQTLREMISSKILKDEYDNIRPPPNLDDEQLISFYKKQEREICKKLSNHTIEPSLQVTTRYKSAKRPNTARCYNNSSKKNKIHSSQSQHKIKGSNNNDNVLSMLFPYINEDDFKIQEYEPGKSTKKNLEVVKVNLEQKIKSNFKQKFKKYDKDLNVFGDKPSIRCSSAYITQEQMKRKEMLESKKKWMCDEDFKKVFGKQTLRERDKEEKEKDEEFKIENSEYKPVCNYAYRTIDKTKWICKKNFIV